MPCGAGWQGSLSLCPYRNSWTGRKLGWVLRLVWILDSFRERKEVGAGAPDLMSGGVGVLDSVSGGVGVLDLVSGGVGFPGSVSGGVGFPDSVSGGVGVPDSVSGGVGVPDSVSGGAGDRASVWTHRAGIHDDCGGFTSILSGPETALALLGAALSLPGWKVLAGLLSRVRKALCSAQITSPKSQ